MVTIATGSQIYTSTAKVTTSLINYILTNIRAHVAKIHN